jgi:UDP-hydrolysing UDP-N-acetyl-D-glucosamine 2-epimerase
MRHAISKLAHLHFVATNESRERLVRMGERPERIVVSGAPGLDSLLAAPAADRAAIERRVGRVLAAPLAVLVQHPVSSTADDAADQMRATLEGLRRAGVTVIALYPNSDSGGRRMITVLESFAGEPWLIVKPTLPHHEYLGLLRIADVLVGNSSSGIIEAPSFGLPVVNVGTRQAGRERGDNVVDVAHDADAIAIAVKFVLGDAGFRTVVAQRRNPYGDGHAAGRIAAALAAVERSPALIQKQFYDGAFATRME